MLVNARSARRYAFNCACCGSPKLESASRRKANAKARNAERRVIKRREARNAYKDN